MPPKNTNSVHQVTVKPKAKWLTLSYIIFSLPGFLASLFWLLITIIILFGVIFASNSSDSQSNSNELALTNIQKGSSKDGILVYNLNGAIQTGNSNSLPSDGIFTDLVKQDFEKIKNNDNIKNIVFKLNTPGGTIFASEVLGDLINDLTKSKGQSEAIFYYDQVVASGGLWASNKVEDSYVFGSPYGETGSIGVILTLPNYSELANKVGYSETVIKSSNSKDIGNPFRAPNTQEVDFLQSQVQDKYNQFIDIVASGREISKEEVTKIANGYVYPNSEAKDFKLIDELSDIDKAIEKAASNSGLEKYNVWEIKPKTSPFQSLLLENSITQTLLGAQKVLSPFSLESSVYYAIDENRIN